MTFDIFVIPFFGGLLFLLAVIFIRFTAWVATLDRSRRKKLGHGLLNGQIFPATWEVFMESLLHRRMFRQNKLLGYMHMCFAFGWFMLILLGNLESRIYSGGHINPPYYPIFLKFFVHDKRAFAFELYTLPGFFRFIMDLLLLFILSGLVLALIKRARSKWFGMKRTTQHNRVDKWAITALWLIFPLRLLAESFTAGVYQGGGFLTNTLGSAFAAFLPVEHLYYPAWWAYSTALGAFFVTLPWSRYMHIPTEILLIYLRHFGIKTGKKPDSFTDIEVHSCPRCGVCIDVCQMNHAGKTGSTPIYFLRALREGKQQAELDANCMLCGRCQEVCPVQIDTVGIRIASRYNDNQLIKPSYNYLERFETPEIKADVTYFAGCMGHLTPAVKKAMVAILENSGERFNFIDADGSVCCGRPLLMAGLYESASELMKKNTETILKSGSRTFVTSCPICFKVFREEYKLPGVEVLHHSQYLLRLIESGKINVEVAGISAVYHDPCELGRGSGVYNEPRQLLNKVLNLKDIDQQRENSVCCGGSLGDLAMNGSERTIIRDEALKLLLEPKPDVLVTACPLCKKTFDNGSDVVVMDLAEIVAERMNSGAKTKTAAAAAIQD
jgi:Fe-S oxidoreductase